MNFRFPPIRIFFPRISGQQVVCPCRSGRPVELRFSNLHARSRFPLTPLLDTSRSDFARAGLIHFAPLEPSNFCSRWFSFLARRWASRLTYTACRRLFSPLLSPSRQNLYFMFAGCEFLSVTTMSSRWQNLFCLQMGQLGFYLLMPFFWVLVEDRFFRRGSPRPLSLSWPCGPTRQDCGFCVRSNRPCSAFTVFFLFLPLVPSFF